MPRAVKKHIKVDLEKWAKLKKRIANLKKKRDRELAPFIEEHNEAIKSTLAEFEKKHAPVLKKLAAAENDILKALKADVDKDGNPKVVTIESDAASVAVTKNEGNRLVDSKKFFEFVKVKNEAFWKSVKIILKDAKDVVSEKEIDKLSKKPVTYKAEVKLK